MWPVGAVPCMRSHSEVAIQSDNIHWYITNMFNSNIFIIHPRAWTVGSILRHQWAITRPAVWWTHDHVQHGRMTSFPQKKGRNWSCWRFTVVQTPKLTKFNTPARTPLLQDCLRIDEANAFYILYLSVWRSTRPARPIFTINTLPERESLSGSRVC